MLKQIMDDIKFAVKCGKEIKVKEIGSEIHFICENVGHWVVDAEEAKQVMEVLPQQENTESLTVKEVKVLKAIYNNTFEIGLPVETEDIKEETGYSKRTIVGVISSLYKKGFVESYGNDFDDEFMINNKGYELAEKL